MLNIYLLPHHDDEIFLLDHLLREVSSHDRQIFIYLTFDNNKSEGIAESRLRAADYVIKLYARKSFEIFNLGKVLGIKPRTILEHSPEITEGIISILSGLLDINSNELCLFAPFPENGHIDHFATCLIATRLNNAYTKKFYTTYSFTKNLLPNVQFENISLSSPLIAQKIRRISILTKSMSKYKSEIRTWLVLGPFLIQKSFRINSRLSIFSKKQTINKILEVNQKQNEKRQLKVRSWQIDTRDFNRMQGEVIENLTS